MSKMRYVIQSFLARIDGKSFLVYCYINNTRCANIPDSDLDLQKTKILHILCWLNASRCDIIMLKFG